MPFASKKQNAKCWAMKDRGQAKGWDCQEWADKTDYSKLPARKRHKQGSAESAFVHEIAAAAAAVTLRGYGT